LFKLVFDMPLLNKEPIFSEMALFDKFRKYIISFIKHKYINECFLCTIKRINQN